MLRKVLILAAICMSVPAMAQQSQCVDQNQASAIMAHYQADEWDKRVLSEANAKLQAQINGLNSELAKLKAKKPEKKEKTSSIAPLSVGTTHVRNEMVGAVRPVLVSPRGPVPIGVGSNGRQLAFSHHKCVAAKHYPELAAKLGNKYNAANGCHPGEVGLPSLDH